MGWISALTSCLVNSRLPTHLICERVQLARLCGTAISRNHSYLLDRTLLANFSTSRKIADTEAVSHGSDDRIAVKRTENVEQNDDTEQLNTGGEILKTFEVGSESIDRSSPNSVSDASFQHDVTVPRILSSDIVRMIRAKNILTPAKLAKISSKFTLVENASNDRATNSDITAATSYSIDKQLYRLVEANLLSGFVIPHSQLLSTPWATGWETSLLASQGQSLQYVDALVEKLALDLNADILSIDDTDLEEIFGSVLYTSSGASVMEWLKQRSLSYLFREVEQLVARSYVPGQSLADREASEEEEEENEFSLDEEIDKLDSTVSKFWASIATELINIAIEKKSLQHMPILEESEPLSHSRLIVHVRDFLAIGESKLGDEFMKQLERQIELKRATGYPIVLVATGYKPHDSSHLATNLASIQRESFGLPEDFLIGATGSASMLKQVIPLSHDSNNLEARVENLARIRQLNARYLDIYLRRLMNQPLKRILELPKGWDTDETFSSEGTRLFSSGIVSAGLLYSLITIIKGLLVKEQRSTVDIELLDQAVALYRSSRKFGFQQSDTLRSMDFDPYQLATIEATDATFNISSTSSEASHRSPEYNTFQQEMKHKDIYALSPSLSTREKAFLNRVVSPEKIDITFENVIAPPRTFDVLKDTVMLSIVMPEEFSYGILASSATSGILLYGPPGTGKTMLAKALAKAGQTTFIEIQPSDLLDQYWGETEKKVHALFSLARKLNPCILFVDEVDSLMRDRSARHVHRDMINQFMSEWDGLRTTKERILVIGTTNRPYDLDEAVLRRFPRRVMVDLPTERNREEIFKIHLQGETLGEDVSLSQLAKDTENFTGSDIKNICIIAATQAVKERRSDTALAALPRRVLTKRHFELALKETTSSISDEMGSLNMIREWDKQFGQDGKRTSHGGFGFSNYKKPSSPVH
ncbi:hypothetical protein V1512DRAFT_19026 [Lipomyces arxii]|uniref:uncharacterized protein n=1 Tax=Lipomyces arxii TaxID=56418 RepID=UPI0034CD40D7